MTPLSKTPGRLLAEARGWDLEAEWLARQNPVSLRLAIRDSRDRARQLRYQARQEKTK